MKVKFDSFTTALCSYVETDIIGKLPQNKKLLMGIAVMAIPLLLSKKVNDYSELLCTLGVMDSSNCVDVDILEDTGYQLMDKYGSYQIKLMDMLIDITKDDITKLCALCRRID